MQDISTLPLLPEQPEGVCIKHIPGYPGYAVTDTGEVWSCRRKGPSGLLGHKWKRLSANRGPHGHLRVEVRQEVDKGFGVCVHRLVLFAFVGPCPEGMECCHGDGNPANNHPSNLRWDTCKGNGADKARHGRCVGVKNPASKLCGDDVRRIRAEYAAGGISQPAIARRYGVHQSVIWAIIRRKSWSHV